jgi:hypothetical protein
MASGKLAARLIEAWTGKNSTVYASSTISPDVRRSAAGLSLPLVLADPLTLFSTFAVLSN